MSDKRVTARMQARMDLMGGRGTPAMEPVVRWIEVELASLVEDLIAEESEGTRARIKVLRQLQADLTESKVIDTDESVQYIQQ